MSTDQDRDIRIHLEQVLCPSLVPIGKYWKTKEEKNYQNISSFLSSP